MIFFLRRGCCLARLFSLCFDVTRPLWGSIVRRGRPHRVLIGQYAITWFVIQVKTEISRSRAMYEKEIKEAHNKQMLEGHRTGVLPPIMTFGAASKSTNSVHADYEAAAKMPNLDEEVDIRDLTWEQKEIVLRRLFAKMNVAKKAPPAAPPVSPGNFSIMASSLKTAPSTAPIPEDADEDDGSTNSFFLTTMEPEAAAGEVSS